MPCNPLNPASCLVSGAGQIAGDAATGIVGNSFAEAMRDGAAWVIKTTISWWVQVPAVDLNTSPAHEIRGYVLWIALVVAFVGVSWQGILLMFSRRPEPVLNVARGLFYVALWASVGIIGPAAALRAGDSFSVWVLDEAASGQAADRLVSLASLSAITSTGAVIVLGLLMMVTGLAQAVLMLFREGAAVILAGVIILAAAGTFTNATRPWLPKVLGWLLALIVYKPAAALIYATALTLTGESNDPRTVVVGLTMMVMAIVALPVLMKFFTWSTGAAGGGNGGGLAALAAGSAAAIHARAAIGSSPGQSAGIQAAHVRSDLGLAASAPPASGAPAAAPTTVPASMAAPSSAAAGATAAGGAGAAAGVAGVAVVGAKAAQAGAKSAATHMTDDRKD